MQTSRGIMKREIGLLEVSENSQGHNFSGQNHI